MRKILAYWAVAAAFVLSAGAAQAQLFDPNAWHRLSTQFRGADQCLDVHNGGPKNNQTHLAPCASYSGQLWKITDAGGGQYRLTTQFRGARMCLDVVNGGPFDNRLQLARCGNYSGQLWQITPSRADGEAFTLKTGFRPGHCADIVNGGPDNNDSQYARCGNYSGQIWYIDPE